MASTPVKTLLVDRFRTGLAGTPAAADAAALKGKSAPEQVRHFESLLDQTNKAAPAQKPAAVRNAGATNAPPRKDPPNAANKPVDAAPSKPAASEKTAKASDVSETEAPEADDLGAANIADAPDADTSDTAVPVADAQSAPAVDAPIAAEETATSPVVAPDESADLVTLAPVPAQPLPIALPIPQAVEQAVEMGPVTDLPPAPIAAAPAQGIVPVDADLAQQEPVILPQAVVTEALALPDGENAPLPVLPDEPAMPADATASPAIPVAKPATPPPLPSAAAQPQAPAQAPQPDAVIESLTVIATDTAPETASAQEAAPAAKAAEPTQDATPEIIAAQSATAAPVVADTQPKAKAATAKPAAETATGKDADALAALPTAEAVPASENEAARDQGGNRDQSHGDKARERGQDRAQTGERLAAKLADSQASLIRDEAALSGPVESFKTALKNAAVDGLAPAAGTLTTDQPTKPATSTQPTMAAAANTTAAGPQTAAAAKSAARAAPVFQIPVVQQVGTRLVETAENGGGRVVMDLRPEHLGRVTIDVDVRDDGRVSATVLVDNPEALEQLRRDGSQLEQALRDSGLNPDQNSLNFGLREQNQDQGGFGRDGRNGRGANSAAQQDADAEPEIAQAATQQSVVPGLGVIDIRI